jgi:hypothetical protein
MRTHLILLTLGTALGCSAAAATEADLSRDIVRQDGWVAYDVPLASGVGAPCCYAHDKRRHCTLDGNNWIIGTDDEDPHTKTDRTLTVYMHVDHGAVEKIRAFGSSCIIDDAQQARRIEHVAAPDSIALLARLAQENGKRDVLDESLAALSMHDDTSTVPTLGRLGEASHPRKLREQALFWLGQNGGVDGAHIVEHVATTDGDDELRAQAVFDLSQTHAVDGYAVIHRIAQTDHAPHVRSQALFWMAQMDDKRAKTDIFAAIGHDDSDEVREQAVFALSQLKEEADAALIEVVRGSYPRKAKEQALFWLGQSGSDAAMKFLDDVLTRQASKTN